MIAILEDFAEPLAVRVDDEGMFVVGEFPFVTHISNELLAAADGTDGAVIQHIGDEVRFWLRNGHAVYRVMGPGSERPGTFVLQRKDA